MAAAVLLIAGWGVAWSGEGEAQAGKRLLIPMAPRNARIQPDERFGVALGAVTGGEAIQNVLARTGAGSWYTFGVGAGGPEGRVQVVLTGPRLPSGLDATAQATARTMPGSWWVFGNEPNVPAQDLRADGDLAATAHDYAAAYRRLRGQVLAADPSARFVVGNTLNLDAECVGCVSQPSGRAFLDAFVASYRQQFDEEPPAEAWGIHAYRVNWEQLPMTDAATPQREIEAFRAYVDALPGQRGKPIWLTEFGVVWGYPCFDFQEGGDLIHPCGSAYAADSVDTWLDTMLGWLSANSGRLGIARWFLFTNYLEREPYATVFGGIRLLDGPGPSAQLTRFGATYERRSRAG